MNTVDIYFNDKVVIFSNEKSELLKKSGKKNWKIVKSSTKTILELFLEFTTEKSTNNFFVLGSVSNSMRLFKKHFKIIEAAGGLIQNNKSKTLFIFRNGKWDLPKGKIEKAEGLKAAAVRECEEECGIKQLKIIKKLPSTFHIYYFKEKWIFKKTYWYLMQTNFTEKLIPQLEEGITKVEWLAKKDFSKVKKNTYPSVLSVLKNKNSNEKV